MSLRPLWLVVFASALLGQGTYTITTLTGAGSTLDGYTGDGGPATQARLNKPGGLALRRDGDLYIADTGNQVVRVVDASGRIRTIAGNGAQGYGGDGGPAIQAQLLFPRGIALDSHGNLYIADTMNHRVRRVTPDGIISTFAGTGEHGYDGDGGPAAKAKLSWPNGIAIDRSDVLYFTESMNNTVRKINTDGVITSVVGQPGVGPRNPVSPLASPRGIALGPDGAIYIADRNHARTARIDPSRTVTTIAGEGVNRGAPSTGDGGSALAAVVFYPMAVAFNPQGNLLIAAGNIRQVDGNGIITTLLGAKNGPIVEDGDPLKTGLHSPADVVVDEKGTIYVADTLGHRVLRMAPGGAVTVVAG